MAIDFQTHPSRYRHWKLVTKGEIAHLILDVDENGGHFPGYQLKLNSYDIGVDIELYDAIQRLRFEHPEVKTVVLRSAKEKVFCAGANIRMLAGASHAHKVNFCKFTNETRNYMEDASDFSGQIYMSAIAGTAAGGGYELALATEHILLADDGSSAVSLPEVPLLAVLPGTGGLTRVADKRKVRRDHADIFSTLEEGIRGAKARDWRLVDEIVPRSRFEEAVEARAQALAARSDRPADAAGIVFRPLDRRLSESGIDYPTVSVEIDRGRRVATLTVKAPETAPPADPAGMLAEGDRFWPIQVARELDDALLHLRFNEREVGVLLFKTAGRPDAVLAYDAFLEANAGHWLAREALLFWKRVMKRIDVTSRTLIALIEPGSCFAGSLAEIAFACDRSYMLEGGFEGDNRPVATLTLGAGNFGRFPMGNGLTRLETRFIGDADLLAQAKDIVGKALTAAEAEAAGLVTAAYDDIDWADEIRIVTEERASFSPDALTGMEANLRFAGPETMETKIFGRLTAWQNWIFQRPNAVGEAGALKKYGTGLKPHYDAERV